MKLPMSFDLILSISWSRRRERKQVANCGQRRRWLAAGQLSPPTANLRSVARYALDHGKVLHPKKCKVLIGGSMSSDLDLVCDHRSQFRAGTLGDLAQGLYWI